MPSSTSARNVGTSLNTVASMAMMPLYDRSSVCTAVKPASEPAGIVSNALWDRFSDTQLAYAVRFGIVTS